MAKILVHLQDLTGKGICGNPRSERPHLQDHARHWFFSPGTDFEAWCGMLDVQPEAVRDYARKVERGEAEPPSHRTIKTPVRHLAAVRRHAERKKAGLTAKRSAS